MKSASRLVSLLVVFFLLLSQFIPVESQFPGRPGSPGQGNSAAAAAQTVEALDIPPLGDPTTAVTYVQSFGETQVAYFDDPSYLNFPGGIGVTANNQVWIAEFVGKRALLFDYDGVFIKQINRPMMYLGYVLAEIQHLCDVAAAPDGNVWLNFEGTLVKADPDGAYVGELSGGPELSYNCKGLAVDGSGNLFVSDWSTQITVYDSSGNHIATIGDPAAGDVEFSTPTDMAISGEVMYVSEAGHDRVSILNISDLQNVTYEGEINEYPVDSEMVRFANPQGVGADATRIFVADSGHNLVHIFDRATKTYQNSLSAIVPPLSSTGWNKPYDIELDSAGRIYISDMNNHRVIQFDENLVLQRIFGTLGVAYKTDDKHFNYPSSVATDSLGNFYVSESGAHRVVKLSAAGVPLGSLGETGIIGDDESHFNYPSGLAVDPANKLYVADRHNHRIMVFTSTGVFNRVFGSYGSDENQFNNPTGVAIDSSHIYVVDNGNERVQVFNLDWSYYTTIGVTGEVGVDNEHFDRPMDVAVDGNGNIYISDNGNARLQKCTLSGTSYTCVTLVGESGVKGDPYTHFQNINGVAVGANNLVYMVDHGMCLIYIYDSSGNFRGSLSNNFLLPLDIAIDSNGNMYVADSMNQRIQKLSPVDLGYTQVSVDHFGDPTLQDYPLLVPYAGKLYASYEHPDGTQIWSMAADETWQIISAAVDPANLKFFSGMEFNSKLYLGSYDPVGAADIYRFDGSSWELVASDGLGEVTNHAFSSMVEFNSALYAGTTRSSGSSPLGAQIWRSFNGNLNSWEKVLDFNSINTASAVIQELVVYNGYLYAMVQNYTTGAQVWRSVSGSSGS